MATSPLPTQHPAFLSHLLLLAFALKTFFVVESSTASRCGAGARHRGSSVPSVQALCTPFPLLPGAGMWWGAAHAGRAHAAAGHSSQHVLPADRVR